MFPHLNRILLLAVLCLELGLYDSLPIANETQREVLRKLYHKLRVDVEGFGLALNFTDVAAPKDADEGAGSKWSLTGIVDSIMGREQEQQPPHTQIDTGERPDSMKGQVSATINDIIRNLNVVKDIVAGRNCSNSDDAVAHLHHGAGRKYSDDDGASTEDSTQQNLATLTTESGPGAINLNEFAHSRGGSRNAHGDISSHKIGEIEGPRGVGWHRKSQDNENSGGVTPPTSATSKSIKGFWAQLDLLKSTEKSAIGGDSSSTVSNDFVGKAAKSFGLGANEDQFKVQIEENANNKGDLGNKISEIENTATEETDSVEKSTSTESSPENKSADKSDSSNSGGNKNGFIDYNSFFQSLQTAIEATTITDEDTSTVTESTEINGVTTQSSNGVTSDEHDSFSGEKGEGVTTEETNFETSAGDTLQPKFKQAVNAIKQMRKAIFGTTEQPRENADNDHAQKGSDEGGENVSGSAVINQLGGDESDSQEKRDGTESTAGTDGDENSQVSESGGGDGYAPRHNTQHANQRGLGGTSTGGSSSEKDGNNSESSESKLSVITEAEEKSSETDDDENNSNEPTKGGAENERDDSFIVAISENRPPDTSSEDQKKSSEDIDRTGGGSQEGENDDLFFVATRAKNNNDGKIKLTHSTLLPDDSKEDASDTIIKPGSINIDDSSETLGIVDKIGSAFGKVKNIFGSSSESPSAGGADNSEQTDDEDVLEKASAGAVNLFGKIKSNLGSAAGEIKSVEIDSGTTTFNPPEMPKVSSYFEGTGIFKGEGKESKEETPGIFGSIKGGLNAAIDNTKDLVDDSDEISKSADKLSGQSEGLMGGISSSFGKIKENLGAAQEEMESGLQAGADKIKGLGDELHAAISDRDNFAVDVTVPTITLSSGESPGLIDKIVEESGSAFGRAKTLFGSSDANQAQTEATSDESGDLMGKISGGATNVFGNIKSTLGGAGEIEVAPPNSEDIADISIVKKISTAEIDSTTHTISLSAEDVSGVASASEGILNKAIDGISSAFDSVKNPFDGATETSHIDHLEKDHTTTEGTNILGGIAEGALSIFGKVKGVFNSSGEEKKSDENISSEKPEATEKSLTHRVVSIQIGTEKQSQESSDEKQGILDKVGVEIGSAFGKVKGIFDDSSESSKEDDENSGIAAGIGNFGKTKLTLPTEEISTLPPLGEISFPDVKLPDDLSPNSNEDGILETVSGGVGSAFGKIKGVFGGSGDSQEEKKGGSWTSGISNVFGDVAKTAETSITDHELGVTAPTLSTENGRVEIATSTPEAPANSGEKSGWMGKVAGGFGTALAGAKSILDGSSEAEKADSSESEKSDGILGGIAAGSPDLFGKINYTMTSKSDSKETKIELNEKSNELLQRETLIPSAPELSLLETEEGESGMDKVAGVFGAASDKTKNIFGQISETATEGAADISQESKIFLDAVVKETSTMFGKVTKNFDTDDSTTEITTKNTGASDLSRFKIDGGLAEHSDEKGTLDSVLSGFGSAFDKTKTIFGSSSENPDLTKGGHESKTSGDDDDKGLLGGIAAGTSSVFGKIKGTLNGDAGPETSVKQNGEEGAHTKIKQLAGEISTPKTESEEEAESIIGGLGNAFGIANTGIIELSESAERRLLETSEEQEAALDILGAVATETSSMFGKVKNILGGDSATVKPTIDGVQFSIPELSEGEIKNPLATDHTEAEVTDTVFGGIGSAFGANSGKSADDESKEQENSGESLLGGIASGTANVLGKIKNTFNTKDSSEKSSGEGPLHIGGEISTPELKLPGIDSKEDNGALGGIGSAFDRAKTGLTETATEVQPTDDSGEGILGAVAKGTSSIFGKVKNIFGSDKSKTSSSESGVDISVPVLTTPSSNDDSSEQGTLGNVWGGIGSAFNKAKSAVEESTHKSTDDGEINEDSSEDQGLLGGIAKGTSNLFGKINANIDSAAKSSSDGVTQMTGEISIPEISIDKSEKDSNEEDGIIGGIGSAIGRAKTALSESSEKQPTEAPDASGEGILGAVAKGASSIFGKVKSVIDGDGKTEKASSETSGNLNFTSPDLTMPGADVNAENSGEGVLSGIGSAFNKGKSVLDSSEKSQSGGSKEQQSGENQDGLFAGVASGTTNLFEKIKDSVPKTSSELTSEHNLKSKLASGEISTPESTVPGEEKDSQEEEGIIDKAIGGIGFAFGKAKNAFDGISETHSTPAPKPSEEESGEGFFGGVVSGASNIYGKIKNEFESDPNSEDMSRRKGSVGVVARTEEEKRKINRIFKSGGNADRANLDGIKKSHGTMGTNNKQSAEKSDEDSDLLGGTLISGAGKSIGKFATSLFGKEKEESSEKADSSESVFGSIINKVSESINATGAAIGKGVDEAEKSLHDLVQSVKIGGDEGSGEVPAVIPHLASGDLENKTLTDAVAGMRGSANSQNADTTSTWGQVNPAVREGGADYDYDLKLEERREGEEDDENSREGGELAQPGIKDVPSQENDVEETENIRYEHNLGSNLISPGTNNVEPSMLSMKQFHDNKGNPEPRVNVTFNAPKDKGVYDMYIDRKGRRCSDFTELPLDVEYLREVFVNSGYSNFQLPSLGVNLNELADKAVFFKDLDDNSILCGTLTINHR